MSTNKLATLEVEAKHLAASLPAQTMRHEPQVHRLQELYFQIEQIKNFSSDNNRPFELSKPRTLRVGEEDI